MKRTTIVLTDQLAVLLEREQRRRGVAASVVVRDALASYFGHRAEPLSIVGLGRSGQTHIASDAEALIAREWTYEHLMGVPENGTSIGQGAATVDQVRIDCSPDDESPPTP